jgi:hypothetical protein
VKEGNMEADEYVARLTRDWSAGHYLEMRILPIAQGGRPEQVFMNGDKAARFPRECERHAGNTVYTGVLPRSQRRGRADDVPLGTCLWVDIDNASPEVGAEMVRRAGLPPPSMVVNSGGGLHCYWCLPLPVELRSHEARTSYSALCKRLALRVGGTPDGPHADPAASDVARVLRPPGTINHRRQRRVRLLRCVDRDAPDYDEWMLMLPPPPAPRPVVPRLRVEGLPRKLFEWAAVGYQVGERHTRLVSDAAWLMRDVGVTESVASSLIRLKARACEGEPLSDRELDAILNWAKR